MSKRAADTVEEHPTSLKAGERPVAEAPPNEMGEFEDEFEDEFESEDEILEAGVDGRPDAEREEEEKGTFPFVLCSKMQNAKSVSNGELGKQIIWRSTKRHLFLEERNWARERFYHPIRLRTICYTQ